MKLVFGPHWRNLRCTIGRPVRRGMGKNGRWRAAALSWQAIGVYGRRRRRSRPARVFVAGQNASATETISDAAWGLS
jgi:hypothetical protein